MHGFVNVVLAATLLTAGRIDEALAEALLDDDRPEVFKFGGRAGSWLNAVVTYTEIAHARRRAAAIDWIVFVRRAGQRACGVGMDLTAWPD